MVNVTRGISLSVALITIFSIRFQSTWTQETVFGLGSDISIDDIYAVKSYFLWRPRNITPYFWAGLGLLSGRASGW